MNFNLYLNRLYEAAPASPDSYGTDIGITDKSDSSYRNSLEQPKSGPIGNLVNSAWANLNVPTRGIPDTSNGNMGCAAATSIIFYRATGLPIIPGKKIVLGTSTLWSSFTSRPNEWQKISNWQTDWQPGDIILTSKGSKAGHVGVIVDGGKIISNSSGGFNGDKKGQIEQNYSSVTSWQSIAKRNPKQTACFRYIGKWRESWGGPIYDKPQDPSRPGEKEMKHIVGGNSFVMGPGPDQHAGYEGWMNQNAWDIMAPVGTPICSVFSGKINKVTLLSDSENTFGWSVLILSDDNKYQAFYANFGEVMPEIKEGSTIKVGDIIGYIGKPKSNPDWRTHSHISIGPDSGSNLKNFIDNSGNIKGTGDVSSRTVIPIKSTLSELELIKAEDFVGDRLILKMGSTGEKVRDLQYTLKTKYGYPLPQSGIDGEFGPETRAAVRDFQRKRGLLIDGEVGEETAYALANNTQIDLDRKSSKWLDQTKFKIYDSKHRKILIAKLESKTYIKIKNRYGTEIGDARLESGRISINYRVKGDNINLDGSDPKDSVYKGIYNIFNRISGGIISEIPTNTEKEIITPEKEEEDVVSGDFKISHRYSGVKATNIQALINEMNRQGVKNPYAQIAILAVIGKECGFVPKNEIMSYSKERLPEVWGVFSKTGKRVEKGQGKYNWNALAAQHERQPEKLANFVYGGQFHNNRSGDGWKYRGRGFNGITFKSGYEKYSSITGIDLVSNPDRLNDVKVASEVAVKFLINGIKSLGKDPIQFTNQQDATYYATKANAGGREIKYDETYAKAKEVEKNFLITA
jgi:predicted chitinase